MSDKEKLQPEDIIYSKEVVEFTTVANEFCNLLENMNSQSIEEFVNNIYRILILLQFKAILLPETEFTSDMETESFVNEADWHFIDNAVSEKLGSFEIFVDLIEPTEPETSAEVTISECLADTYQDLKDFTQIYHIGSIDAVALALTECKRGYEQFWGPRIMTVIREFHLLIFGEIDLSEENSKDQSQIKGENWLDNLFEN